MTVPARSGAALAALALGGLLAAGCGGGDGEDGAAGEPAATVVVAETVRTLDPAEPEAEAFAYDAEGTIIAVGSRAKVERAAGPDAELIDAGDATVLPGFQDTHAHVPEAGINESLCLLPPGKGLGAYAKLVAECAAEQQGSEWVRAAGASLFELQGASGRTPLEALDKAVPDRPVLVLDDLGHAVWVNSAGLKAAGIAADEEDPPGGILERSPDDDRLTGLLLENAQHRARDAAAVSAQEADAGLRIALQRLAEAGVTTVSDSGGYWTRGHPEAWIRAAEAGELTVRARNALYVFPDSDLDEQVAELGERFDDDDSDLLSFDTAKLYADGILDLGTASLLEPYDEPPDPELPSGFAYFEPEELADYAQELHELGFRLEIHAIGDGAVRDSLDAIEAIEADGVAERGHRTTHTYMVSPEDIERFARLGVGADLQAGPVATSGEYHRSLEPLIGERSERLLPVAELARAGARVTLSSDWDADPLDPLGTIATAATRESNAVTPAEALEMVTIEAAEALGHAQTTGSIAVGKQADFVIVDADPLATPPRRIADIAVERTVVGGRTVWSREEGA